MDTITEVIKLKSTDLQFFKELLLVFEDVFEMENFMMPDEHYLSHVLNNNLFMVYVLRLNDTTVGGLTAYVLPSYYFNSSQVYIYDLAVRGEFQRKGFGRKIITTVKSDCKAMGFKEIFVQADQIDEHALEFYRGTGGNAERVVHFTYPL